MIPQEPISVAPFKSRRSRRHRSLPVLVAGLAVLLIVSILAVDLFLVVSNGLSASASGNPSAAESAAASVGSSTSLKYGTAVRSTFGLVSYWRLNEASGTVAADATSINPGTYVGLPALGQPGVELIPDTTVQTGPNAYVKVPDSKSLDVTGAFTFEGWFKASATLGDDRPQAWFGGAGKQGAYAIGWQGWSHGWTFEIFSGGERLSVDGQESCPVGAWQYVVGTYEGSNLRLYVNGQLAGSKSIGPKAVDVTTNELDLGMEPNGLAAWSGWAGQFALYSTALSSSTIHAHYQAALGK